MDEDRIWDVLLFVIWIQNHSKKDQETQVGLVDQTKTVIKNRIDDVEKSSEEEMEVLITMIWSLNNRKSAKPTTVHNIPIAANIRRKSAK